MTHDVVVIGRGVIGQATALALADAGVSVALVGPTDDPGAASHAAGAMLGALGEVVGPPSRSGEEAELHLRIAAQRRYPSWLAHLADRTRATVAVQPGTFVIANAQGLGDLAALAAIESLGATWHLPVQRVDPSDVEGLTPASRQPVQRALYLAGEGSVDGPALMAALGAAVGEHRSISVVDRRATGLAPVGSRHGVVLDGHGILESDAVVVCAGHGTATLLRDTVDELPQLIAGKGSSLTVRPSRPRRHVIRTPNREFACGVHVVPRGAADCYIGATNRISRTPGNAEGPTVGEMHSLLHSAVHEIDTGLRNAALLDTHYGWRPLTADHFPVVGTVRPGLVVATGTYRNGMLMAPIVAEWACHALVEGVEHPDNAFSPSDRPHLVAESAPRIDEILDEGARELIAFVMAPHGVLPYARERELTAMLGELMRVAFDVDGAEDTKAALQQMMTALPMPEVVADLYYELARRGAERR